MWRSTKTYGPEVGLSACFRQWRATHSHCRFLHGYALSFKFVFECEDLDERNWCVDFGALKWLKGELVDYFDHKLMVAADDPMLDHICELTGLGIADVVVVDNVGCERFAEFAYNLAKRAIERDSNLAPRVRVVSCECAEHGANSAIYQP
jgi:6-pyruvoyltetrahydropterin/6-carboxytetrahydropterin synthase